MTGPLNRLPDDGIIDRVTLDAAMNRRLTVHDMRPAEQEYVVQQLTKRGWTAADIAATTATSRRSVYRLRQRSDGVDYGPMLA